MPRYTTPEGIVLDRSEDYVRAVGAEHYTRVPDDTPLTPRECCGGDGWVVNGRVVRPGDPKPERTDDNA